MKRLALICLALIGSVSIANADIISTTGDFLVVSSATANYNANSYNDPTEAPIRIWIEQQPITVATDVLLDTDLADPTKQYVISGAGVGQEAFAAGAGPTVSSGTSVNVYYVHFDPLNDIARGTVTFDTDVLGIVAYTDRLQFSDFLRVPGAPYPGNPAFAGRGWEDTEWGQLSADRRTLTFNAESSSPGDQFRIITAVPAAPEPVPMLLVFTAVAAAFGRRMLCS